MRQLELLPQSADVFWHQVVIWDQEEFDALNTLHSDTVLWWMWCCNYHVYIPEISHGVITPHCSWSRGVTEALSCFADVSEFQPPTLSPRCKFVSDFDPSQTTLSSGSKMLPYSPSTIWTVFLSLRSFVFVSESHTHVTVWFVVNVSGVVVHGIAHSGLLHTTTRAITEFSQSVERKQFPSHQEMMSRWDTDSYVDHYYISTYTHKTTRMRL